jgi:hypothetical protein
MTDDRSETISESDVDMPFVIVAAAGVVGSRRVSGVTPLGLFANNPGNIMNVYAKSLSFFVGLGAGGMVIGACWSAGLVPWYVATMAGLALATVGGWQLRRMSLRDRHGGHN